jgi:RND family efflux transporter MFP subunit
VLATLVGLGVLAGGAAGLMALVQTAPRPETKTPEVVVPLVRVVPLSPADLKATVSAQGTVAPRTESALVAEVPGRLIYVSPALAGGGFFSAGEGLVRLEKRDFELSLVRARSAHAQARMKLVWEKAQAEIAREEWKTYGRGAGDPLTLREPQVAEAEAAVAAAEAAVEQAERDLKRTEVVAPYAGRVREKRVDVGQYVTPGTVLARVYAVDAAEVRLPIPQDEVAFLDLPLEFHGDAPPAAGPKVTFRARFGDRVHEWTGAVVRTEAEVDPKTRMLHAVARVDHPYERQGDRPPFMVGLFVEAEIEGRPLRQVYEVPRAALRDGNRLLVVDAQSKLRLRRVEVIRAGLRQAVLRSGVEPGDRACVSPVDVPVDGMSVKVAEEAR